MMNKNTTQTQEAAMATRTITADVEHIPGMTIRAMLEACRRECERRNLTAGEFAKAIDWICVTVHDEIEGVDRSSPMLADADAEALARYPE